MAVTIREQTIFLVFSVALGMATLASSYSVGHEQSPSEKLQSVKSTGTSGEGGSSISLSTNEGTISNSILQLRASEYIADSIIKSNPNPADKPKTAIENQSYRAGYDSSSGMASGTTPQRKDEVFECGSPENLHKGSFTFYDYGVVCGMLIISLGIGVFYGFCDKSGGSSNDFLLGSEMKVFPVTLSLTTSFITAIELLGNPSEIFYQGTQYALIVIPMVLVIPVAVKVFYPIYFKLELTSCYEYLGIRFGKEIRILGGILYIIQMSFYTSVAVLAPAIALSKATGLDTTLAVVLIYVVCIFYASQGGMKAVVVADTFQACVLAVSLVLILVLGHFYTGDIITVFDNASKGARLEFFNFDPNPLTRHTVWSIVIGGFFYWTSLFCTNQASVQKCMSLKSLKKAKIALIFAIMGLILVFLINFYTGLVAFTHYSDCDPLSMGEISAKDQLLPFYVMNVYEDLYSITGIFVAGIFAASLGTVASALNSLSAVTCEDLLVNGFNIKMSPEKGAAYAKWMSLGYGVFSFALVFVVERLGGILQATLTLNGLVGGVTLGLFVLGICFKKANTKGAFYGGIAALVIVICVGVMAQITNVEPEMLSLSLEKCDCYVNNTIPGLESAARQGSDVDEGFRFSSIFEISYMWFSMLGCVLTILLGLMISIITDYVQKQRIERINKKQQQQQLTGSIYTLNNSELSPNEKEPSDPAKKDPPSAFMFVGTKYGHDNIALKIDDEK